MPSARMNPPEEKQVPHLPQDPKAL